MTSHRSAHPRVLQIAGSLGALLPLLAVLGCAEDAGSAGLANGDADFVVEGELPAGVDVRAHLEHIPPGGFGVIADPGTGQVATIYAASSPFARIASSEFSVVAQATCPDCNDPGCTLPTRTMEMTLRQNSGPDGATYRVRTASSQNFVGSTASPADWTSEVGVDVTPSITGTLPVCAPFSYYFDVEEVVAPPTVPACDAPPCFGDAISDTGNSQPRGVFADASGVYWANRGSSTIRRADLDGGNPTNFATIPALGLLWGDATHIYAPEYAGTGVVHRIRKSDGFVDTLVTIPNVALHGIDFIDGAFYFTTASGSFGGNLGQVYRYLPGDPGPTLIDSGLRDRMFGIAHDPATDTTFLISNGPGLGATGLIQTTSSPPTGPLALGTMASGFGYPIQAQATEGFVYVAVANDDTVERIPFGSSTREVIAQCPGSQTYGVWVYDAVAYFTCLDANELRAVGLP